MPIFTPSAQGLGVGIQNCKFYEISEYKALARFYEIFTVNYGQFFHELTFRTGDSLKGFRSYGGLTLVRIFFVATLTRQLAARKIAAFAGKIIRIAAYKCKCKHQIKKHFYTTRLLYGYIFIKHDCFAIFRHHHIE